MSDVVLATLIQTQRELSLTRKTLDDQAYTFSLQRFENTFFQMLRFHNENFKPEAIYLWIEELGSSYRRASNELDHESLSKEIHQKENDIEQVKNRDPNERYSAAPFGIITPHSLEELEQDKKNMLEKLKLLVIDHSISTVSNTFDAYPRKSEVMKYYKSHKTISLFLGDMKSHVSNSSDRVEDIKRCKDLYFNSLNANTTINEGLIIFYMALSHDEGFFKTASQMKTFDSIPDERLFNEEHSKWLVRRK